MYPQWNGEGKGDAREYQAGSSILLLIVIIQYTATALTLSAIQLEMTSTVQYMIRSYFTTTVTNMTTVTMVIESIQPTAQLLAHPALRHLGMGSRNPQMILVTYLHYDSLFQLISHPSSSFDIDHGRRWR
jgi:hypothetical protein